MPAINQVYGVSTLPTLAVQTFNLPAFQFNAGADMVVGIVIGDAAVSVSTVTDSRGYTYRFRVSSTNSDGVVVEIWETQGIPITATSQITVTMTAFARVAAAAWMYAAVKVEAFPSPQDTTTAAVTSSQIAPGAAVSDITSWAVSVFGWQSPDDGTGLGLIHGNPRIIARPPVGGVSIAIIDSAAYASPIATFGFQIEGPLATMFDGSFAAVHPWAAATLELRSAFAVSADNSGGPVPPSPPWVPPPAGTLVTWSYTYTVSSPTVAPPASAEVTCHFLGSGCTDPQGNQGNEAY